MIPKILNLGSGSRPNKDYFNADILERVNPDWLVDISGQIFGSGFTSRFGDVIIRKEMFEKIIALDVLEHIPDLVSAMENCRDLLVDGGIFEISVPYELSLGAWQDPTHVRAFNENSWLYYTTWAEVQLGWKDKFEIVDFRFMVTEEAKKTNLPIEKLLKIPRMVDSMYIVLKKVKYV